MGSKDLICVYCGNRDLAFFTKREHVIPQSFGTFGSETPTLQCVCDGCNSFLRELDQLLARETLEGITRYKKGRFSRETREQKELRFSLADVAEVGDFAGALVAGVEGRTGKDSDGCGRRFINLHSVNVIQTIAATTRTFLMDRI
jgi:hypothetical protein